MAYSSRAWPCPRCGASPPAQKLFSTQKKDQCSEVSGLPPPNVTRCDWVSLRAFSNPEEACVSQQHWHDGDLHQESCGRCDRRYGARRNGGTLPLPDWNLVTLSLSSSWKVQRAALIFVSSASSEILSQTIRPWIQGYSASHNVSVYAQRLVVHSCICSLRDGHAELTSVAGCMLRWFTRLLTVTHSGTNQAWCRTTLSIETNTLALHYAAISSIHVY